MTVCESLPIANAVLILKRLLYKQMCHLLGFSVYLLKLLLNYYTQYLYSLRIVWELTCYNVSISVFCSILIFFSYIPRCWLSFKEALGKKKKLTSRLNLIPFHESGLSVLQTKAVEATFSGRESYSSKEVTISDLKACLLELLLGLDWNQIKDKKQR